jgi:hypothetical protein
MEHEVTFLQCGGGWVTNIGNAFIDMGAMYALRKAVQQSKIALFSTLPKGFLSRGFSSIRSRLFDGVFRDSTSYLFDSIEAAKADYMVFSGSSLNPRWLALSFPFKSLRRDVRIVFLGVGGSLYTREECEAVGAYLDKIRPYAFISRDDTAFKHYNGIAEHSFSGIDCAFFADDYFDAIPFDFGEYITLTFDKMAPPRIDSEGKTIIRPHHSCWPDSRFLNVLRHKYVPSYDQENTLITDLPQEYLNVYFHTTATHSDRVHACVPTLAFGKPARLYSRTPRAALFDRFDMGSVREKLTSPDLKRISKEKEKEVKFLSEILNPN